MKKLLVVLSLTLSVVAFAQDNPKAQSGKSKCYLLTQPSIPAVKSCDANLIQSSLTGYDMVGLWRFKSPTEIEFKLIRSQDVSQIQTNIIRYTTSGNLITMEPIPNCFITSQVDEGKQYRKEYFKKASPGCPEHIINASKIATEELKSGRNKGLLIINE